jgi:hypothetical protein
MRKSASCAISLRPPARAFGEISFGQSLQPPGDPPEQMFPVPDRVSS